MGGRVGQDIEALIRLAQTGDVESALRLGMYFTDAQEPDRARGWWEQAAFAGHPMGMLNLGLAVLQEGRIDEGTELILKSAEEWLPAMGVAADLMEELGRSRERDELVLRAMARGARQWWEEDFANGDTAAGLRIIRFEALQAVPMSLVEASMALGVAWTQPDEFVLQRTAMALRACDPSPWRDGDEPEEIAYLALSIAREYNVEAPDWEAFRVRDIEGTQVAYSRREAAAVDEALLRG